MHSYSTKAGAGSISIKWDEDAPPSLADLRSLFSELTRQHPDVFDPAKREAEELAGRELDHKDPSLLDQKDYELWAERREKKTSRLPRAARPDPARL